MTDASDVAVRAVLQQYVQGQWQPISYFSRQLSPTETRYSTYDRELLAIYLAIKYFRYFVEGCQFYILTDHKPLTYTFSTHSDGYSPRQVRHLDFIYQFTTDIRHVRGCENPVADALSRAQQVLYIRLSHSPQSISQLCLQHNLRILSYSDCKLTHHFSYGSSRDLCHCLILP